MSGVSYLPDWSISTAGAGVCATWVLFVLACSLLLDVILNHQVWLAKRGSNEHHFTLVIFKQIIECFLRMSVMVFRWQNVVLASLVVYPVPITYYFTSLQDNLFIDLVLLALMKSILQFVIAIWESYYGKSRILHSLTHFSYSYFTSKVIVYSSCAHHSCNCY